MSWSIVYCQYEGAGYGPQVKVLVETTDIEEARQLIRGNKDKIDRFSEHSVSEEHMWDVNHPSFSFEIASEEDVRDVIRDLFGPDYAIFQNGTVLRNRYAGEVSTVTSEASPVDEEI